MANSNALDFESQFGGRRVLVTGHTGFTGCWLTTWLTEIGAQVSGFGLDPISEPNLHAALSGTSPVHNISGNLNNPEQVAAAFSQVKPQIVFHLGAQALVSTGYDDPVSTFMTNTMGTLHVLEAARNCPGTEAVVCITTDKVYLNRETGEAYNEDCRLGGKDPYSASKACAELVAACYIQTMVSRGNDVTVATARGGNIIGGGDWSRDRIVPDYVRARVERTALSIRNPESTRPFQHVLCLVHGYLLLGSYLLANRQTDQRAWNLGPTDDDARTVRQLVDGLAKHWDPPAIEFGQSQFPEANLLNLDSSRARDILAWRPPLTFDDTVELTANWYRRFHQEGEDALNITLGQIRDYRKKLGSAN